jgi:hypothetical protein
MMKQDDDGQLATNPQLSSLPEGAKEEKLECLLGYDTTTVAVQGNGIKKS